MEQILIMYYADNAKKLHRIVDKILLSFGGILGKDADDFYSLANEVFADVISRYDASQPFDSFLYSCLSNKIKTEMTRRNREKRKADRMSISLYMPVRDKEGCTVGDMLVSDFSVEKELIDKEDNGYSQKMLSYLNQLSELQKEVLMLDTAGYLPNEIRGKLHIDEKQYAECYAAIRSYRNVSILF
ncbi:MAG: hypothetical protein NC251_12595 [Lachnoclostridium sp.]|nr:hypothetical protein [Lachnospira sp.]MCM1249252.1 hypothetical protein [Lachnoclostridium sp.]MCM1536393.1 hypothetical protein [Clostridium sp.]